MLITNKEYKILHYVDSYSSKTFESEYKHAIPYVMKISRKHTFPKDNDCRLFSSNSVVSESISFIIWEKFPVPNCHKNDRKCPNFLRKIYELLIFLN